jgi:DNA-binding SARP family transcriptional activator
VRVDHEWVQLLTAAHCSIDVLEFESAFAEARGLRVEALRSAAVVRLADAVRLYKGDLLEGWYQGWCLEERERLRRMYLTLLDKLVAHFEATGDHETGIEYARLALERDRARERTHRALMRLLYVSGDRTGALRQYERCVVCLREELDVEPEAKTRSLYESIRRSVTPGERELAGA